MQLPLWQTIEDEIVDVSKPLKEELALGPVGCVVEVGVTWEV